MRLEGWDEWMVDETNAQHPLLVVYVMLIILPLTCIFFFGRLSACRCRHVARSTTLCSPVHSCACAKNYGIQKQTCHSLLAVRAEWQQSYIRQRPKQASKQADRYRYKYVHQQRTEHWMGHKKVLFYFCCLCFYFTVFLRPFLIHGHTEHANELYERAKRGLSFPPLLSSVPTAYE